jgi:hypothetical protein
MIRLEDSAASVKRVLIRWRIIRDSEPAPGEA